MLLQRWPLLFLLLLPFHHQDRCQRRLSEIFESGPRCCSNPAHSVPFGSHQPSHWLGGQGWPSEGFSCPREGPVRRPPSRRPDNVVTMTHALAPPPTHTCTHRDDRSPSDRPMRSSSVSYELGEMAQRVETSSSEKPSPTSGRRANQAKSHKPQTLLSPPPTSLSTEKGRTPVMAPLRNQKEDEHQE